MLNRRGFVTVVVAMCALGTRLLRAQTSDKVFTIGLLRPEAEPAPGSLAARDALVEALRDQGWTEGKNIVIETRWAGLNPEAQRKAAAELKSLPVALIIAPGTITIRAARDGAPGVPVVMVNAGDPVGSGFVRSLARPGGLLTGTSAAGEEVLAKQLELLSTCVPQLKKVHVLMNKANPANDFFFNAMTSRAKTLRLQLERADVIDERELEPAIARANGGALVVVGDPMFFIHRVRIATLTIRNGVPSIYGSPEYVRAGGLMSYLSPVRWHWRTAASFVDKILKGANPADIPVEQPTQFELVINTKTAQAIGIAIPQALLLRADEVI